MRSVALACFVVLVASCAPKTNTGGGGSTPVPTQSAEPIPHAKKSTHESVDSLARAVFAALQLSDEDGFTRLIASDDDLAFIAQTYEVNDQNARDAIMLRLFKSQERVLPSFHSVHGLAEAHGLDWSMAMLERVEYEVGEEEGVAGTDAELWLQARGERFRITLDDCIRLPRGWVLTDRMSWQGLQE